MAVTGCSARTGVSTAAPTCHPSARPEGGPSRPPGEVTISGPREEIDVASAYDKLVRAGLRVAFTRPASLSALIPAMVSWPPPLGNGVPRGAVVELTPMPGGAGSPAVPTGNPRFRVPNLVGCRLSQAVEWAGSHGLDWSIPTLPSPTDSTAPHLFEAYRVISQEPNAGATLGLGVREGNGYRVTPLTLNVLPITN